jgi:hypothetical protein
MVMGGLSTLFSYQIHVPLTAALSLSKGRFFFVADVCVKKQKRSFDRLRTAG